MTWATGPHSLVGVNSLRRAKRGMPPPPRPVIVRLESIEGPDAAGALERPKARAPMRRGRLAQCGGGTAESSPHEASGDHGAGPARFASSEGSHLKRSAAGADVFVAPLWLGLTAIGRPHEPGGRDRSPVFYSSCTTRPSMPPATVITWPVTWPEISSEASATTCRATSSGWATLRSAIVRDTARTR
jgi:hypothetical protein